MSRYGVYVVDSECIDLVGGASGMRFCICSCVWERVCCIEGGSLSELTPKRDRTASVITFIVDTLYPESVSRCARLLGVFSNGFIYVIIIIFF